MISRKGWPFFIGPGPIILGIAVIIVIAVVVVPRVTTSAGNGGGESQSTSLQALTLAQATATRTPTPRSTASATPQPATATAGSTDASDTPTTVPLADTEAAPTATEPATTLLAEDTAIPTATDTPEPTATPSPTATPTATPTPVTPTPTSPPATGGSSMNAEAAELFSLINQFRVQNGLPALSINGYLVTSAQAFAKDQGDYNYFAGSHVGRDGSTPCQRIAAAGYPGDWRGETVNAGQLTPQQSFDAWLNSPPHRAIMLDSVAQEGGVGFYQAPSSDYGTYWVLHIGSQPKTHSC